MKPENGALAGFFGTASLPIPDFGKGHSNIAVFVPHAGCPHQCSFCNQRSITGAAIPPSLEDVRNTFSQAWQEISDRTSTEIAFFGGSFTAMERETMRGYLETAAPFVGEGGFSGIRISTRPDAIDSGILSLLREYRVTAIELGAQSMDDRVLAANGRGHTADDVRRASGMIREAGFQLGLQMMLGLYGEAAGGELRTAEEFLALHPDTVRIYPTVVLRNTRLAELYYGNQYQPLELCKAVELGAELLVRFGEQGIRVIRMGLHASREVEEQRIAGSYHPAYRELCENRIYLRLARQALEQLELSEGGNVTLWVNHRAVSKMAGQRQNNLSMLRRFGDFQVQVKGSSSIPLWEVRAIAKDGILKGRVP